MRMLDRTALIVRPKRRFVEWANGVSGGNLTLEVARLSPKVYLAELIDALDDRQPLIDAYGEEIFELELSLITEDESRWPANRRASVFRDWFDIEVVEFVEDAAEDEPLYDDGSDDDLFADDLDEDDAPEDDGDLEARILEAAQSTCAWCDRVLSEDAPRLTVSMRHADPDRLANLHGTVLPVGLIGHDVPLYAIVPTADSEAWSNNAHLLFTCCSEECASELSDALRHERSAQLS